ALRPVPQFQRRLTPRLAQNDQRPARGVHHQLMDGKFSTLFISASWRRRQRYNFLAAADVPDLDHAVAGAADNSLAVPPSGDGAPSLLAKVSLFVPTRVAFERPHELTGLDVPQSRYHVAASRHDAGPIGTERGGGDAVPVPLQLGDNLAAFAIPNAHHLIAAR